MIADHKTKILYAVGVGLILSDLIPTPADAIYFSQQRKNKQALSEGKITPKQYWGREVLGYYGLNVLWWAAVLGVAHSVGKDYKQKRNLFIGLIAAGAVGAVIYKNIKKDEEFYGKK